MGMERYFQDQKEKIIKQLKFAKENIPKYKEILKNVDLNKIQVYADFISKISLIDSEEVVNNPKLFSSNFPIQFIRHSSGTTGKPKKVFLTKDDLILWTKEGRLTSAPYFKEGMVVAFSKRKEKYYLSALKKSIEFSKGSVIMFDPHKIEEVFSCLKKADLIFDYAEMIYFLSEKLAESSYKLEKKLVLGYVGNKLEESEIDKIKENFKKIGITAEVYSEYGTTEIGPIGCSNNTDHNKFKIVYDNICFIEIIDPLTNQPSEEGEIVITSLGRSGSVFIRYKIGDLGKISFNSSIPNFHFHRRKKGMKIASVFFSPEQVFRIIRKTLNRRVFSEIYLKKKDYLSDIFIKVFLEESISEKDQQNLRKKLLTELEIEDDIGTTVKFNLIFEKSIFDESQMRKGYKFIMEEDV